jgi:hypothetical protein
VPPVRYELSFYVPEDSILHSYRRANIKSYIALTSLPLEGRRNVFPVRYDMGSDIQKPAFFTVAAAKTSDLAYYVTISYFT